MGSKLLSHFLPLNMTDHHHCHRHAAASTSLAFGHQRARLYSSRTNFEPSVRGQNSLYTDTASEGSKKRRLGGSVSLSGIDGSPSKLRVYYVTSAGRPHSIALGVEAA